MGVPVLLVPGNTMETVESLDRIFGKTRMGQKTKLEKFQKMITENLDLQRLDAALNL
jgi:BioD-like phosphotransacetylase family protein